MARNVDKYPPLPTTDEYVAYFQELLKEANGFVYQGERAYGIMDAMDALRVLRDKPELAAKLLTLP